MNFKKIQGTALGAMNAGIATAFDECDPSRLRLNQLSKSNEAA